MRSDCGQLGRLMFVAAVLCAVSLAPSASAQRRAAPDRPQQRPDRRPPPRDAQPGRDQVRRPAESQRPPHRDSRPALDRVLGPHPLEPRPEDAGPLRKDEQRELERFVRARMPELYRHLQQARRRDPRGVAEFLNHLAPRLRHLRRVFEQDEALGRRMLQHIKNGISMRRAQEAWNRSQGNPAERRRIAQAVRSRIAENRQIELNVLDDWIGSLERDFEGRREELFNLLLSDEANLAAEPQPVRELVAALENAPTDAQRRRMRDKLLKLCGERLEMHLQQMRARHEHMQADAEQEVERRFRDTLDRLNQGENRRERGFAAPEGRRNGGRP